MLVTAWLSGAVLAIVSMAQGAPSEIVQPSAVIPWPAPGHVHLYEKENWEGGNLTINALNQCATWRGNKDAPWEMVNSFIQGPTSNCSFYLGSACTMRMLHDHKSFDHVVAVGDVRKDSEWGAYHFSSVRCVPNPPEESPRPSLVPEPPPAKRQDDLAPGSITFYEDEDFQGAKLTFDALDQCHQVRGADRKGDLVNDLESIFSFEQGPHSTCHFYLGEECNMHLFEHKSNNTSLAVAKILDFNPGYGFHSVGCSRNDPRPADNYSKPPAAPESKTSPIKRQSSNPSTAAPSISTRKTSSTAAGYQRPSTSVSTFR